MRVCVQLKCSSTLIVCLIVSTVTIVDSERLRDLATPDTSVGVILQIDKSNCYVPISITSSREILFARGTHRGLPLSTKRGQCRLPSRAAGHCAQYHQDLCKHNRVQRNANGAEKDHAIVKNSPKFSAVQRCS